MQVTLVASVLLATVVAWQVSGAANPCSMEYEGHRKFKLVQDCPRGTDMGWTDCCLTVGSEFHFNNATVGKTYHGSCANDPIITPDMPDVCRPLNSMGKVVPGLPRLTGESL